MTYADVEPTPQEKYAECHTGDHEVVVVSGFTVDSLRMADEGGQARTSYCRRIGRVRCALPDGRRKDRLLDSYGARQGSPKRRANRSDQDLHRLGRRKN